MESQHDSHSGNAYHQVVKVIKELPAAIFKDILKSVAEHSPDLFKPLIKKENISIKGFRINKIFSSNIITEKVYAALIEERNRFFLKKILIDFFADRKPTYNEGFLERVGDESSTSPEVAFAALEDIAKQWGDEPLFPLYRAALMWIAPKWFKTVNGQTIKSNIIADQNEYGKTESVHKENEMIGKTYSEFLEKDKALNFEIQKLKDLQHCDVESLINCVKNMNSLVGKLRVDMCSIANDNGIELSDWKTRADFENQMSDVLNKVKKQAQANERAHTFFSDLKTILGQIIITHRSIKKMQDLQDTLNTACGELSALLDKVVPPKPEGPDVPFEWLKWVFDLNSHDFARIHEQILNFSKALAVFVEECEWAWIRISTGMSEKGVEITEKSQIIGDGKGEPLKGEGSQRNKNVVEETKTIQVKSSLNVEESTACNPKDNVSKVVSPKDEGGSEKDPTISPLLPDDTRISKMESCLVKLLNEGYYGLAYHLLFAASQTGVDVSTYGGSGLAKALALSSYVLSPTAPIIGDYKRAIESIEVDTNYTSICDLELLSFAVEIQAALLAPYTTNAHFFIDSLTLNSSVELNELRKIVLQCVRQRKGSVLSLQAFRGSPELKEWQAQLEKASQQCEHFLYTKQSRSTSYAKATYVIQSWFSEKNMLGRAFKMVVDDKQGEVNYIKEVIKCWGKRDFIEEQIDKTSNEKHKRHRRKKIEGTVRQVLIRDALDSVDFLSRWVDLLDNKPESNDLLDTEIVSLRSQLHKALDRAIVDFSENHSKLSNHNIASVVLCRQLRRLRDILDYKSPIPIVPKAELILGQHLFIIPGLKVKSDFNVDTDSWEEVVNKIISFDCCPEINWFEIFNDHIKTGNHIATRLLLEVLEIFPKDDIDLRELRKIREKAMESNRSDFQAKLEQVKRINNQAIVEGLFREEELRQYETKINGYDPDKVEDFQGAFIEMEAILKSISESRKKKISDSRSRLNSFELKPRARKYICDLLDKGDLLMANEYIERYRGYDGDFPSIEIEYSMPAEQFCKSIESVSENAFRNSRNILKSINQQKKIGPFSLKNVRGAQLQTSQEMMKAWFALKDNVGNLSSNIQDVFQGIGFQNPKIENLKSSDKSFECMLYSIPINDSNICPIPHYGSKADGRYKILGFWGRPTEDAVISEADRYVKSSAVIILWFGRFSKSQRLGALAECRRRHSTSIIIDEYVLLYACTARSNRLNLLLPTVLPFTIANPYSEVGSHVPQEMFFGRKEEQRQVIAPEGGNLVYGGRQLGKTALLLQIERTYHDQSHGLLVKYVDLKHDAGIGEHLSIDSIWKVTGDALSQLRVVSHATKNVGTIKNQVVRWLNDNKDKRILLLFDEADKFLLEDDKADFREVGHFKDLMDRTQRRFKVVFAGLHNVQRTSRRVNQSLAQFGSPISIGPLIESNGWVALNMIKKPFEALGYKFESQDVLLRILAYTNYYPCLIQLYCKHLLRHLNSSNGSTSLTIEPPYTINQKTVEWLYQSDNRLRQEIVNRFRWTLDLDPRYRVVALVVALQAYNRLSEGAPPKGMTISEIYEEAACWWPRAYGDSKSLQRLAYIVQEMCELGVLYQFKNDAYGLRNPNLLRLLGSQETMENELAEVEEMEIPVYAPEQARRFKKMDKEEVQLSPLTASQESMVLNQRHGIVFISGSPIGQMDVLPEFIEEAANEYPAEFEFINSPLSSRGFSDRLLQIDSKFKKIKKSLYVVYIGANSGWTERWVELLAEVLGRKTSSTRRFFRIVFFTDPSQTIEVLRNKHRWSAGGLEILQMAIEPWHKSVVERWVDQLGVAHSCDIDRLEKATGLWGGMLIKVGNLLQSGLSWPDSINNLKENFDCKDILNNWFSIPSNYYQIVKEMISYGGDFSESDFEALDSISKIDDREGFVRTFLDWAIAMNYMIKNSDNKYLLATPITTIVRQPITKNKIV